MKSPVSSLAPLRWLVLLPALLLAGCARPEAPPRPATLLPKEVVTSILIQNHLLEARLEISRMSPDSARALFLSQERDILWRHNIAGDDSSFQRSYRYYAVHDKDLEEIYAAVIDSLTEVDKRLGGTPSNHPY